MHIQSVVDLIALHEGRRVRRGRHYPYKCPAGKWTIGYGHNLDATPLSTPLAELQKAGMDEEDARCLLVADIQSCVRQMETIDEFRALDEVRRAVLLDMCFNLGFAGLMQFRKMWRALERQDWDEASDQMLLSKWAGQVGRRADRLALMMMSGVWPAA